jgi:DNA-binding NtrC family response regulator
LLCDHFLDEFELENGPPRKSLSLEVSELFKGYRWPGNVRELRNTVMYIAAVCRDRVIGPSVLPPIFSSTRDAGRIDVPEPTILQDIEKKAILDVLTESGGNKKRAAERLGMSRNTLYRKLREYGMDTDGNY